MKNIKSSLRLSLFALAFSLAVGSATQAAAQVNYAKAVSAVGVYYPVRTAFYLQDSDGSGVVNVVSISNPVAASAVPVAGDWTGTGFDSIGIYNRATATFYLKNSTASSGAADTVIGYGWNNTNCYAVAGNWTGTATHDGFGIYNPATGTFFLKNQLMGGVADITETVETDTGAAPPSNSLPIVGDWLGDGKTRVGFFDPNLNVYYFRENDATPVCTAQTNGAYHSPTPGLPITGKWLTTMTKSGYGLFLSTNNYVVENNVLNGPGLGDEKFTLGPQGHEDATPSMPIVGKWQPTHSLLAGQNTSPTNTPSWLSSQIVYEMRIETFTNSASSGSQAETIAGATGQLPYLASLGITAVSLNPIEANGQTGDIRTNNAYGNYEPNVLEPRLGTDAAMTNFVTQAHALGIKVFVDVVSHGIGNNSPYISGASAFPYDYFSHNANGSIFVNSFGCDQLDWTSPGLMNWWLTNVGVGWVSKYGIDGYRMDLAPATASYPLWSQLRSQVLSTTGKQIVLIPELDLANDARAYTYDTTQDDYKIDPANGLLLNNITSLDIPNLVDAIKADPESIYSCSLSNHDNDTYVGVGKLSRFAYGVLLSPFIPRWFMGEEFNATPNFVGGHTGTLYFNQLNLAQQTTNAAFLNQVKQLVQMRKTYQNILNTSTGSLETTNIAKATTSPTNDLPPYTMWNGANSITVLASDHTTGTYNLSIPIGTMGLSSTKYFMGTNLLTGANAVYPNPSGLSTLTLNSIALTPGGLYPLLLQSPVLYDNFNYTTSNLSGHAPVVGSGTWQLAQGGTATISTDNTKAIINVNNGVVGSGTIIGNLAFTTAANTIYTLQASALYNGPVGAGKDCWLGLGFSNVTGGANSSTNPGPWMLLRPQGVATDNPGMNGFKGNTVVGGGNLAASNFASPPGISTIILKVTWNTKTGQAQYYVNGVLQSAWTTTTTLPTVPGTFYALFQAWQTGSAVNVKEVRLTTQPAP